MVVDRRRFLQWSGGAVVAATVPTGLLATACTTSQPGARPSPSGPALPLPVPRPAGRLTLEEVLATRQSVRDFTDEPVTRDEIGQLLWSAQGVTRPNGHRTTPSAGALYALELYATTADGTVHYVPDGHRIEQWSGLDLGPSLARATGQDAPVDAPCLVVVTVTPARLADKYGSRAARYADLEAGHATQNLLLQAVALGLGAVPVGSFDDGEVATTMRLADGEQPRYVVALGHPA